MGCFFKSFFNFFFIGAAFSENNLCLDGLKFKLSITVSPRGPPKQGHCVSLCVSMYMYHFAFQGEQTQECWVKNYFWGLLWILAWIRHRVTSVLTATDAKTPTDLSEERKVYSSVTENHGLSGTLPYVVFKHIFFSFSITDIADMWQGVIFIGREFFEKDLKWKKVPQIAEGGIELSPSPWKECLLYEEKKEKGVRILRRCTYAVRVFLLYFKSWRWVFHIFLKASKHSRWSRLSVNSRIWSAFSFLFLNESFPQSRKII